jgi:hypothetical protein
VVLWSGEGAAASWQARALTADFAPADCEEVLFSAEDERSWAAPTFVQLENLRATSLVQFGQPGHDVGGMSIGFPTRPPRNTPTGPGETARDVWARTAREWVKQWRANDAAVASPSTTLDGGSHRKRSRPDPGCSDRGASEACDGGRFAANTRSPRQLRDHPEVTPLDTFQIAVADVGRAISAAGHALGYLASLSAGITWTAAHAEGAVSCNGAIEDLHDAVAAAADSIPGLTVPNPRARKKKSKVDPADCPAMPLEGPAPGASDPVQTLVAAHAESIAAALEQPDGLPRWAALWAVREVLALKNTSITPAHKKRFAAKLLLPQLGAPKCSAMARLKEFVLSTMPEEGAS